MKLASITGTSHLGLSAFTSSNSGAALVAAVFRLLLTLSRNLDFGMASDYYTITQ